MPDYSKYSKDRTEKICINCNLIKSIKDFRIKKKNNKKKNIIELYKTNICKKCEQKGVADYRKFTPEGRAAEIVRRTKSFCKTHNLPFDLDKDWVLLTLESQKWKCALTGIEMSKNSANNGFAWNSLSIDRIDAKKGYVKENVRFILNIVNLFRNDGNDDRMYLIAQALLDYRKEKL
jgi:hypothetical protein